LQVSADNGGAAASGQAVGYSRELLPSSGIMSIAFQVRPTYTGNAPSANYYLVANKGDGGAANRVMIGHSGGVFNVKVNNSTGGTKLNLAAPFSPIAGTTYSFKIFLDITGQQTSKIYQDGNLRITGTPDNSPWDPSAITGLVIGSLAYDDEGSPPSTTTNQRFSMRQLRVLSGYNELDNVAKVDLNSAVFLDGVYDISFTETIGVNQGIRFIGVVNGIFMYFNGVDTWLPSDGTYDQANTSAQVIAGIPFIDVSAGVAFGSRALLYALDWDETPTLAQQVINYDFYYPIGADPVLTTVYGFLKDIQTHPPEGEIILVRAENEAPQGVGDNVVIPGVVSALVNAEGRFELALMSTLGTKKYNFYMVIDGVSTTLGSASVPDQPSINIVDLPGIGL